VTRIEAIAAADFKHLGVWLHNETGKNATLDPKAIVRG
jgi:hypothetical protein